MSAIQIDCLTAKLSEVSLADLSGKCRDYSAQITSSVSHIDGNKYLKDSDAILVIKKLQEKVSSPIAFLIFNIFPMPFRSPFMCRIIKIDMQITILEMEKSSSQQNFNNVCDLATEQTISAQEKYEMVHALAQSS